MSSDKHCCVPGCMASGDSHKVLHGFPHPERERDRFNTWLYAVGSDILGLENERIYKYRRICRSHFSEDNLCRSNRLSRTAVPTLNMPGLSSSLPTSVFTEQKPMRKVLTCLQPSTSTAPIPLYDENFMFKSIEHEGRKCTEEVDEVVEKENIEPDVPTTSNPDVVTQPPPITTRNVLPHYGSSLPTSVFTEQKPMRKVLTCLQPSTSTAPLPLYDEHIMFKSIEHEGRKCTEEVDEMVEKEYIEPAVPITSNPDVATQPPPITTRNVLPHYVSKRALRKGPLLTCKEKETFSKIVAAKRKIRKLKNKVKQQAAQIKAAKKMGSNSAVLDVLENSTSSAKLIMKMQIRENRKKEKGRRFTLNEKIVSLCMMKQSPKAYNFFRKIFILPSEQTLIKLIQKFNLRPGMNHNIFSQLKKKAQTMKREEKLCVLLFDEVSLKAHVSYNQKKDKVTGFVDDGNQRKQEFADHAQVFMVRGLIKNYKQAVSYTFSASATKGPALAKQIKDVVSEVQKSGLIVVMYKTRVVEFYF